MDYPDFAHAVAQAVSLGKAWRGIMIDGAGIGSCIVANKVPGVRAGMAYDVKVCTVIGFPLGATSSETKAFETETAIRQGATEIDMVINIGALKARDLETVAKDIRGACGEGFWPIWGDVDYGITGLAERSFLTATLRVNPLPRGKRTH